MATILDLIVFLIIIIVGVVVSRLRRAPRNANPTRFLNHRPVDVDRLQRPRQQATIHRQDMQGTQQLLDHSLVEVADGLDIDAIVGPGVRPRAARGNWRKGEWVVGG
ncbi:hypothetical protein SNOG_07739 [Parastagonospora nodorum SN15]|uniref:Uncharacterized protein n=1 Tax=Phaeosphaeria nodorum (strain SN15 / ATCC MYA-4574 / FGSC 10173) TaxID=321614 RepID=Q0UKH5_PHANO|nr:hypothetical protein SNOG_07739 [Parastagonospora nodorum SN15]EAT85205.1 hypothetical protein SNOG_07739 [Parastagonospora nodorum SN15]